MRFETERLDTVANAIVEASRSPGLAVAVCCPDGDYVNGFGYADLLRRQPVTGDTQFRIASITKGFTAAAVALLVEEGKLRWDDLIEERLPNFELTDSRASGRLTLRDAMSHQAGFGWLDPLWYNSPWDRTTVVRRAGRISLGESFRRGFRYSNLGFILAGEVLAHASSASYEKVVRDRLLDPLAMRNSGFGLRREMAVGYEITDSDSPSRVPSVGLLKANPACGLRSCAGDLTKWLRMLLDGGTSGGRKLVAADCLQQLFEPQVEIRAEDDPRILSYFEGAQQLHYGLGWFLSGFRGRTLISHTGSLPGYRAHIALMPEERVAVAVLANLSLTWAPDALVYSVFDQLLGVHGSDRFTGRPVPRVPRKSAVQAIPEADQSRPDPRLYCGSYSNSAFGEINVGCYSGTLIFEWANYFSRMRPKGADSFLLQDLDCPLLADNREVKFLRTDSGPVEGLEFVDARFGRADENRCPNCWNASCAHNQEAPRRRSPEDARTPAGPVRTLCL